MKRNALPILMYHQISPVHLAGFARYTVSPSAFAKQMSWLRRVGYTSVSMDDLLAQHTKAIPLPKRPVLITFDDGLAEGVSQAVPILQTKGFRAIFYLVAGLMGKESAWLNKELGYTFSLVDWATARQLEADGFQCGAHTWSHPRLSDVSLDESERELDDARRLLEAELGHPIRHFAYPYGAYTTEVRARVIAAGYQTACSTRRGLSSPTDDRWALQRVSVYGSDTLLDFICRLHSAQSARELLRRAFNRFQHLSRSALSRSSLSRSQRQGVTQCSR